MIFLKHRHIDAYMDSDFKFTLTIAEEEKAAFFKDEEEVASKLEELQISIDDVYVLKTFVMENKPKKPEFKPKLKRET